MGISIYLITRIKAKHVLSLKSFLYLFFLESDINDLFFLEKLSNIKAFLEHK